MKIFIIGHISPDLDAIASAAEYGELLTALQLYPNADIIPARAGEPNKESRYIFDKFGVELPEALEKLDVTNEDRFILTDHNEETQRHKLIDNSQIIGVIDHHKVNINFSVPINIDVRPLGSTSSIVYELFKINNLRPKKGTAGLMLSGLLSDTQGLKASTTTETDKQIAQELAQMLGVALDEMTLEIFKAKSDIEGLSIEEIAKKDYKSFDFGGKIVFINQVETVEPDKILKMKDALVEKLTAMKSQDALDLAFIVVTDILKEKSQIIYPGVAEEKIVASAFGTETSNNTADIGPRMSRKKDIAPAIEKAVTV